MVEAPQQNDTSGDINESTSLSESPKEKPNYGGVNHNTYDIEDHITLKVFLQVHKGTVFYSRSLWAETAITGLLYWVTFACLCHHRWENFGDFVGKEADLRAFISMFSTLIGLLLSFYTALNLNRWWQMRLMVQNVQEGCKKLALYMAHGVTSDVEILDAVRRYARASLLIVFSIERAENPLDEAVQAELLTPEEVEMLMEVNSEKPFVQAEALWAWLANIVTRLDNQGLTKGPPHYCALMHAAEQGRAGIAGIKTYLETPIPMGYVHLLCWMVKLHNIILTLLMALTSTMLAGGKGGFDEIGVFRTAFRAFFMPFLYNSILVLNGEVTDPFGNDMQDFDGRNFDKEMDQGAGALIKAAQILPPWIADKADKKTFAGMEEPSASA